jgi:2-keto-3-deoxy-L-rhamnonate aldolase RhmA
MDAHEVFSAVRGFRRKLLEGRIQVGAGITFSDPLVSDALAPTSDFLWIDTEHGGLCPDALHGHLLAAKAARIPAFVRVTSGSVQEIKPVLDCGADGIIVPQISSADDVRAVVQACRYRPLGSRGFGPRVPTRYGRDGGMDYLEEANRSVFVAVQIENVEACDELDAILEIEGLDSVVIGPADLSLAMGLKLDLNHPVLLDRIEDIATRARAAGLFVGAGMGPDAAYARRLAGLGVQWLQIGCDFSYVVAMADQIMESARTSDGPRPKAARSAKRSAPPEMLSSHLNGQ